MIDVLVWNKYTRVVMSIAYIWRRKRKHSSELLNLKLINSHEQKYHCNR